jgi:hypothetical protein
MARTAVGAEFKQKGSFMKKFACRPVASLLALAFLTCSVAAIATAASPLSPAAADAKQFHGFWKLTGKRESVVLVRTHGNGQLALTGQDANSAWTANCSRINPGEFACKGTGEMIEDGNPFLFNSVLSLKKAGIGESWTVEGRRDGKLESRSGSDQYEKISVSKL